MSVLPTASATLGNLRYDTHAIHVRVSLALLPSVNWAEVRIPVNVRFEAAPGDDALLDIDGGEGTKTVLTGKVRQVRRSFTGIQVIIADGSDALAALRPSVTYQRQNAGQVIRALGADAGASLGSVDLDIDLPAYVADPRRTAAEHVARLARLGGCIATGGSDGKLNVLARPTQPASALMYRREIIEYRTTNSKVVNLQRFAMGFGPAGSGSAPNALQHSNEALPSDAADGGVGVLRQAEPMLRTPGATSAASTALKTATAGMSERLFARCFLLPALRPSEVIEVQSLPDGMSSGAWLLTRVTHELSPAVGGHTVLEGEIAAPPFDLLGSLLSGIGGLL